MTSNDKSFKIFASPLDSYFDVSELHITPELLEDNLKTLAEENQMKASKVLENDGYFKEGKATELIFNVCKRLSLSDDVKYVAVELFDNFMSKHITELYEIVKNSSSKEKQVDWKSVEARIKDQAPLRALSCIQVASKLISHYKALTASKVKRFLSSCGLQYSVTSVVKSEMRVLRTIDYRMCITTPLTYVEMLLEVLRRNCPGLEASLVHSVTVKVLDVAYMQNFYIYQLLCESAGVEFDMKLSADMLLLATCSIVTAAYVIDSESNDKLIEQMSLITCIEEADIIMFATILVKVALDVS
ncbi:cyclin N-terminal domain-containing protein 1-like [Hydractinia symbiolongicarpus]|uniref:cyclin N-terminal domain-containing protein 1-like n=1 Tax=Hydractinia symbiolongicarpus TaxID=13093 RepID=UPI00254AAF58|nr:cyclin N-terminal domain-containing protein 1-like [Hydractinia symbiolongicarpus]XP_057294974.1 cyclin N-terminal domain-containing protein 1-like [Hydractinia symbiolongicarpus]